MLENLFQEAHLHPILQGICTFVDHSTRGKLSFAYLRDYRTIPRPHSRAASLSSPSTNSSNRPLGLFNFSPDEVKLPISPCSTKAGMLQFYSHNHIFPRQCFSYYLYKQKRQVRDVRGCMDESRHVITYALGSASYFPFAQLA